MTEEQYQAEIERLNADITVLRNTFAEREFALLKQLEKARVKVTAFGQALQSETKERLEREHESKE